MTDNEIIKALGICIGDINCLECPYVDKDEENKLCNEKLFADVCDLINRQKAEIERLKAENEEQHQAIINALHRMGEIRSEAVKEFAERIFELFPTDKSFTTISRITIKQIVKAMTEDEGK